MYTNVESHGGKPCVKRSAVMERKGKININNSGNNAILFELLKSNNITGLIKEVNNINNDELLRFLTIVKKTEEIVVNKLAARGMDIKELMGHSPE